MRNVLSLVALGIVSTAAVAHAAEWREGVPSAAVRATSNPIEKARVYLTERADSLGVRGVDFAFERALPGVAGATVVRLEQRVGGVRVLGKGAVVHVTASGDIARVASDVLQASNLDAKPTFDAVEALATASDAVGVALPAPESTELVVLPMRTPTLAWHLDVRDSAAGTRYVVDARTGAFLYGHSLATHALGRVYTANAVETPTPVDVELALLDPQAPQKLAGWSGLLNVTNYVSGGAQSGFVLEQSLEPSNGTDFLYDPPANVSDAKDGFAQVNLFHHLTDMRQYFELLGVDQSAAKWKVTAVANALEDGQPLDNAFFSPMGQSGSFAAPNLIAIGQGSSVDFATDADVFKHEFGHYASKNAVNYNLGQLFSNSFGLQPHSGSIDEGIADYFACSHADDAELGEGSLGVLGAARDLTDTSKRCPEDLIGEVHFDGEIIGSLSWSIREALGTEAGDTIVWSAIEAMPAGGNFDDYAKGLLAATQDLVSAGSLDAAAVATVTDLLAARGLDDCGNVIALDVGETKQVQILGLQIVGQAFGASCSQVQGFGVKMQSLFQFASKPPVDAPELRFLVESEALGPGDLELVAYARKGKSVRFETGPGGLPSVADFDLEVPINAATGEIVVPGPFAEGDEWFFTVTSSSCPIVRSTVSVNVGSTSNGAGGAGGAGGGPEAGSGGSGGAEEPTTKVIGGCGCRVGEPEPTQPAWAGFAALGALGLAAMRRRRGR